MGTELSRISGIDTPWSIVRRAHAGSEESVVTARRLLLEQYGGAVRRYLLVALRDPDAAEEVFQEFALRLVRGDYRHANPDRGRFRHFVKASIYHLIVDYRRKKARKERHLIGDIAEDVAIAVDEVDLEFIQSWRTELFNRTWSWLEQLQQRTEAPYFTALRLVVEASHRSSEEIAKLIESQWGRPMSAGNARVVIHRARQMFADQLIRDVADSLESPTSQEIEEELVELQLLEYCRAALARWPGRSPALE